MANTSRILNPRLDWIVFLIAVGFSLTLLFLGRSPAMGSLKREVASVITTATKPLVLAHRTISLWQENKRLRDLAMALSDENSQLRDAIMENERLRAMLDFRRRFPLPVVAAEVVAVPGPQIGGKLVIDAGSRNGITVNSAVLTPRGLVGKVTEVAQGTSVVQSLVGNAYGVSVMIERSRVEGILRWNKPGQWSIVGLATGEDVRPGDLVITTGAGSVFPKGIRVAVVNELRPQDDPRVGFCRVTPFVDFSSVEEVFVVTSSDSLRDQSPFVAQDSEGER
jgi:rod shape-determining protein MreC